MNWQQMVKDLLESGFTQVQLAEKLACSQSMVSDLASGERGSRLSWDLGNAIIKAHDELRRQQRQAA